MIPGGKVRSPGFLAPLHGVLFPVHSCPLEALVEFCYQRCLPIPALSFQTDFHQCTWE